MWISLSWLMCVVWIKQGVTISVLILTESMEKKCTFLVLERRFEHSFSKSHSSPSLWILLKTCCRIIKSLSINRLIYTCVVSRLSRWKRLICRPVKFSKIIHCKKNFWLRWVKVDLRTMVELWIRILLKNFWCFYRWKRIVVRISCNRGRCIKSTECITPVQ